MQVGSESMFQSICSGISHLRQNVWYVLFSSSERVAMPASAGQSLKADAEFQQVFNLMRKELANFR